MIQMRKRPRGFIDWTPRKGSARERLLEAILAVLDEYADFLPLTIRQVYYRLIGVSAIDKDVRAYNEVQEVLVLARRARIVPFSSVRDDGITASRLLTFDGIADFAQTILNTAEKYKLDRQRGQPRPLCIWCESAGMVPQIERVSLGYGVKVLSTGGFDSLTLKEDVATRLAGHKVLHIGDFDVHGEHIYTSLSEDVMPFASAYDTDVEFTRLAVTQEQIEHYDLPPEPLTGNVQAEALDPADLAQVVQEGIESRMDMETYEQVMEQEEEERERLIKKVKRVRWSQ